MGESWRIWNYPLVHNLWVATDAAAALHAARWGSSSLTLGCKQLTPRLLAWFKSVETKMVRNRSLSSFGV